MECNLSDFYIGQRVRLRYWDELVSMYGFDETGSIRTPFDVFPADWRKYCGKEGVIIRIEGNVVRVDGIDLSDLYYTDVEPAEEMGVTNLFSEEKFMEMLGIAPT